MSTLSFAEAVRRAERRDSAGEPDRRPRSDRGRSRLAPELLAELVAALETQERPSMSEVHRRLAELARRRGLRPPARSTIYEVIDSLPGPELLVEELPPSVRRALWNVAQTGPVPASQVAFHCLQSGAVDAMSFAAGLPWLALHQAARRRGWRPKSRGVLAAVLSARGLRVPS